LSSEDDLKRVSRARKYGKRRKVSSTKPPKNYSRSYIRNQRPSTDYADSTDWSHEGFYRIVPAALNPILGKKVWLVFYERGSRSTYRRGMGPSNWNLGQK
jgi:hypothetical protein